MEEIGASAEDEQPRTSKHSAPPGGIGTNLANTRIFARSGHLNPLKIEIQKERKKKNISDSSSTASVEHGHQMSSLSVQQFGLQLFVAIAQTVSRELCLELCGMRRVP